VTAELDELIGDWQAVRDLTPRIEATVAQNLRTPCVRNQRTLLVCAAASRILGDVAESERLEGKAEALDMQGYELALSGPRLRLALLRDDVDTLERLTRSLENVPGRKLSYWMTLSGNVTRLDALVRLGDRSAVEDQTASILERERPLLASFALRALGQVRGDRSLIEQALARFEAMQLHWHAEQTRQLLTA
jgi:hypothetical protein